MRIMKNPLLLVGLIFLIVGLAFLPAGLHQRSVCSRLMTEGVSVQGENVYVRSGETWYTFEAEGREWTVKSNFHSSLIDTNLPVTLWYMPGNPAGARITAAWTWGMFLGIGGVFAAVGAAFVLTQAAGAARARALRMSGQPVEARVTGVEPVRSVRINGRHPYVVCAVCTHPYTGQEMQVKSRTIIEHPGAQAGDGVTVYVDPMHDKRCFMDLDSLTAGSGAQQ